MFVDISVLVTQDVSKEALANVNVAEFGHLGTHFDDLQKL
jgi:hypothetical protein